MLFCFCLFVHQDKALTGLHFPNLTSASVVEESFEYLDAPVERISGADVPMPYAANLERLAVPQVCSQIFSLCSQQFDFYILFNHKLVVLLGL